MIYTSLTKKAMNIAYKAHDGQMDKSGVPYIFHPVHVAEQCDSEYTCTAALLHDVIEDCEGYSFELLEKEGIPLEVVDALKLLTHDKCVPYMEYIENIASNEIAMKVKINDLKHNLDDTRLSEVKNDNVKEKLIKKRELYKKALHYLEDKLNK